MNTPARPRPLRVRARRCRDRRRRRARVGAVLAIDHAGAHRQRLTTAHDTTVGLVPRPTSPAGSPPMPRRHLHSTSPYASLAVVAWTRPRRHHHQPRAGTGPPGATRRHPPPTRPHRRRPRPPRGAAGRANDAAPTARLRRHPRRHPPRRIHPRRLQRQPPFPPEPPPPPSTPTTRARDSIRADSRRPSRPSDARRSPPAGGGAPTPSPARTSRSPASPASSATTRPSCARSGTPTKAATWATATASPTPPSSNSDGRSTSPRHLAGADTATPAAPDTGPLPAASPPDAQPAAPAATSHIVITEPGHTIWDQIDDRRRRPHDGRRHAVAQLADGATTPLGPWVFDADNPDLIHPGMPFDLQPAIDLHTPPPDTTSDAPPTAPESTPPDTALAAPNPVPPPATDRASSDAHRRRCRPRRGRSRRHRDGAQRNLPGRDDQPTAPARRSPSTDTPTAPPAHVARRRRRRPWPGTHSDAGARAGRPCSGRPARRRRRDTHATSTPIQPATTPTAVGCRSSRSPPPAWRSAVSSSASTGVAAGARLTTADGRPVALPDGELATEERVIRAAARLDRAARADAALRHLSTELAERATVLRSRYVLVDDDRRDRRPPPNRQPRRQAGSSARTRSGGAAPSTTRRSPTPPTSTLTRGPPSSRSVSPSTATPPSSSTSKRSASPASPDRPAPTCARR